MVKQNEDRPPVSQSVEALLSNFHAHTPIRAWSMIITVFGDCVLPRGGTLWLGTLTRVMEAMDVGPGVVRTAMSRLASDGWLDRSKIGRNSYYRLTDKGEITFKDATRRIYFDNTKKWQGKWIIGFLAPGSDRAERREKLLERGFGAIAPNVVLRPYTDALPQSDPANCVFSILENLGANANMLANQGWPLEKLAEEYREFNEQFAQIEQQLDAGETFSSLECLLIRTLLIHDFRRVVLKDPQLPQSALPEDWQGEVARRLCAKIYHAVLEPSEQWLDSNAQGDHGPLPAPDFDFYRRFNSF